MTPFAVELSVCIGVGGFGCPISVSMFLRWTAPFALMKIPPSSDFAVEEMTDFMICACLVCFFNQNLYCVDIITVINVILDRLL